MTKKTRVDNKDWPNWLNQAWQKDRGEVGSVYPIIAGSGDGPLGICTLEGPMRVSWNDYIIKGVQDELYACKEDIFLKTYEPEDK